MAQPFRAAEQTALRNNRAALVSNATMFVGHLAVGLAAKRVEPRISLGTWLLAALLADLMLFPLLLADVEHVAPVPAAMTNRMVGVDIVYSHSLVMDGVWAAIVAGIWFAYRRESRGAWLLAAAVLSHWMLDAVSHRPDMPIAPGLGAKVGLGLWNSVPATLIVEGGAWLAAIAMYVRATRSRDRVGEYGFWIGVVVFTSIWHGNISAGMDPSPVRAGVGGAILFALIIAWGYWMDRARPRRGTRDGYA